MKFSPCGRLLATGGQDNLLIVWVLKDAYSYFNDMRTKYSDGMYTVSCKCFNQYLCYTLYIIYIFCFYQ